MNEEYEMKAYFSKALAEGYNESRLIDEFLIKIASRQSTTPAGTTTQDPTDYKISWNETDDYHALAFPLPIYITEMLISSIMLKCPTTATGLN